MSDNTQPPKQEAAQAEEQKTTEAGEKKLYLDEPSGEMVSKT